MSLTHRRSRPRMGVRVEHWYRSQTYRQWVAGWPCWLEGKKGHVCVGKVVCAHMRLDTDGCTSEKPSDWWCWALCDDLHGNGAHPEQHRIGEPAFFLEYGITNPLLIPSTYWWHPKNSHRLKYERDPSICIALPPPRPGTIAKITADVSAPNLTP